MPDTPFSAAFARTLRLSQFAARVAAARPERVRELEERDARAYAREEMRAALAAGEDLGIALRALRERVMLCLAHRDLNDLASLDEVFATVSALADECIGAAARDADAAAGSALVVAALGKLGGEELNVSSDVDLVFLYELDEDAADADRAAAQERHVAAGRHLIALLSEVTAHGQAFRVDMRLRPFGDSGPLVCSLPSLENYFVGHARPWERYAWLKARVVHGTAEGVHARVQPFVYRRYLDYGMLESLRDMHGRILEAAAQRRKSDDIKVGAGGIREIEFAVQLFQMVRGGRDPALRTPSTRAALHAVAERTLLDPAAVKALGDAYAYLRRLEHRLQYYDDQQTQALPRTDAHRAAIAESMGHADYDALLQELQGHRDVVQRTFEALFEQNRNVARPLATRVAAALFDPQGTPDADTLAEPLGEAGIVEAEAVARRLLEYTRSRRYRGLSANVRSKLERLLPELIGACAAFGGTDVIVARLIALVEAIDRREAYFSLLVEFPRVLQRAAGLMAKSAWAARLLARHPILLDELTRSATSFTATDWAAEREALARECAALDGDVERLLDHLRHFKQRHVLRFTIADLEGELPVMALSDELSALADTILDVTVAEAAVSVGFPRGSIAGSEPGARRDGAEPAVFGLPGFCVVGYGKLGGKELGYGSDLDVIFLFDESLRGEGERLARLAQRVNTWMTSHTAAGVLYETDLRLRPDGASGLLVSSLEAFREYQLKRAWTWEHQALTRARACAGDRALGARFEAVRDEILALPRAQPKLLADIVAMRGKMREEHRREASDIKHARGGVIDLEFCVQALVLAEGPRHPGLRENRGNHELLRRAGELGLIAPELAARAGEAYLAMRRRTHAAALNDEEKVTLGEAELAGERDAVRALWQAVFPGA